MPTEYSPRVFVSCHPTIGDTVGLTPLFRWIRLAHPDALVVAMTGPLPISLLQSNPNIDEVLERPAKDPVSFALFVARLRSFRFDTALITYGHNDSVRLCRYAGIPRRIVMGPVKSSTRPTEELIVPPRVAVVPTTISLLAEAMGIPEGAPDPEIYLAPEAEARIDDLLRQHGIAGEYVAFQLGASRPMNLWPSERFQQVWESIDLPSIIVGGPGEVELSVSAAAKSARPPLVLAGKLSLMESAALIKRAKLLVTNDTGMMHMGGAVGTKVVAMYRNGMLAGHPPGGTGHALFEGTCACNPPDHEICTRACMFSIPAEPVLDAVRRLLDD